jgi:hypothetical protein
MGTKDAVYDQLAKKLRNKYLIIHPLKPLQHEQFLFVVYSYIGGHNPRGAEGNMN